MLLFKQVKDRKYKVYFLSVKSQRSPSPHPLLFIHIQEEIISKHKIDTLNKGTGGYMMYNDKREQLLYYNELSFTCIKM